MSSFNGSQVHARHYMAPDSQIYKPQRITPPPYKQKRYPSVPLREPTPKSNTHTPPAPPAYPS